MTVGERIKNARKKAGLTQEALANKCGLATGTIQQYELNKRLPKNKEIVERIAEVLNVSGIYLLWGDELQTKAQKGLDILNKVKQLQADMQTELDNILLSNFHYLNDKGQTKAIEQVEMLTKIPEYQKNNDDPEQE